MGYRTPRYGVTFEQVVAAAESLVSAGMRASLRAIRVQLGNTGSLSTIQKHMDAWAEGRPDLPESAAVGELRARLQAERRLSEQQRRELIRLKMRLEALGLVEVKYLELKRKYEELAAGSKTQAG